MHTVTAEWIHRFATDRHGWTSAQIRAIGIAWPPANGWIDYMAGSQIADDAAREFERARDVFTKATMKKRRKHGLHASPKIAYAPSQRQREAAMPGQVTYDYPPWQDGAGMPFDGPEAAHMRSIAGVAW